MKTAISVASVLACAFSLDGQITATLNPLPGGMGEVRIRNNSATSLVAFAVARKRVASNPSSLAETLRNAGPATAASVNVMYSDPLIDPAKTPLLANEERVITVTKTRVEEPIAAA